MKRTTKKAVSLCLCGMGVLFCGMIVFLWLVWPNLIEVNQSLLCFSGEHCSVEFACASPRCAAFELCFEDEAYVPESTGMIRLYGNDVVLHEFNIAGFDIANGFRGNKMVGKKRYRIKLQSSSGLQLEDVVESSKNVRAECSFSGPIPRVLLLYTCIKFESHLQRLIEWGRRVN